jgi:ribonuclease HII
MERARAEKAVIRDSKKMTPAQREKSRVFIEKNALAFGVCWAERDEIDTVNILRATMNAFHRVLDALAPTSDDKIMVDGSYWVRYGDVPHECVVRGDDAVPEIACASILAKTHRDRYVLAACDADAALERYGLRSNKGYGTAAHLRALREHGPSGEHRCSFHPNQAGARLLTKKNA